MRAMAGGMATSRWVIAEAYAPRVMIRMDPVIALTLGSPIRAMADYW